MELTNTGLFIYQVIFISSKKFNVLFFVFELRSQPSLPSQMVLIMLMLCLDSVLSYSLQSPQA